MKVLVAIDTTLKINSIIEEYFSTKSVEVYYKDIGGYLEEYQSLAEDLVKKKFHKVILFTTGGIDAFLVASKVKDCVVAPLLDELTAERVVSHNNAKFVILPLSIISISYAIKLIHIFLNSKFEGGRHSERISMLNDLK